MTMPEAIVKAVDAISMWIPLLILAWIIRRLCGR
jgi:hypothetical protein